MARPQRSPLLGYNHNVKYKGRVYHVQTEDSGPGNPHLFTHLYYEGTIVATKRHQYDGESPEDLVRSLMQSQHKSILKELRAASYDDKLVAFFRSRGEQLVVEMDTPAPIVEPPTVPSARPVPVADTTLDLDALTPPTGLTPPPEMVPVATPHGAGMYTMKNAPGSAPRRPSELMPVVVFEDPSKPPPMPSHRPAPVPGRRPASGPVQPLGSSTTPPPGSEDARGVAVQRQVVVGIGGGRPPAVVNRAKRPVPPIPYVVKEGSHPTVSQTRTAARPAIMPARPGAPPASPARPLIPPATNSSNAPRTSSTPQSSHQSDLISDKSLDEVILAYLSQGEDPSQR